MPFFTNPKQGKLIGWKSANESTRDQAQANFLIVVGNLCGQVVAEASIILEGLRSEPSYTSRENSRYIGLYITKIGQLTH